MPHRRGSFHEDWNDLLVRFAHRGTPAALQDQIEDKPGKKWRSRPVDDPHKALFELSNSN